MADKNTTLAQMVAEQPAAAKVLHGNGLDFCCGGKRTLDEACEERGLDPDEVLAEIDGQEPGNSGPVTDWKAEPPEALVEHIIERYHVPLRVEIPRLLDLARTVEQVHSGKPGCPVGLAEHLEQIQAAVDAHLDKEEQILFPMIVQGRGHLAFMPVQVMLQEHDDHAANLKRIRELTDDLSAPPHACESWRELYRGLNALELELMEHIHLENNVLFPKVLAH